MADYTQARTQFVKNLIKETSFENRGFIGHLMTIEDIMYRGGPKQWAEGMMYNALVKEFRLEYEAIRKEIKEGIVTGIEEYYAIKEAACIVQEEKARLDRRDEKTADERREQKEREEWLKAGGLP